MESKFQGEMEEHKQKLDKEYESTRQNFMLEIDRLKKKMVQDLEKKVNIRREEMLVSLYVCDLCACGQGKFFSKTQSDLLSRQQRVLELNVILGTY